MADQWVAPGSRPVEPFTGAPLPGAAGLPTASPDPAAPALAPAVPVPLQPLATADLLDASLRILQLAPRTILAVTAVFVLPAQALGAYLARDVTAGAGFTDVFLVDPDEEVDFSFADIASVDAVLQSVALALACASIATIVWGWYAGTFPTPRAALGAVARRSPALLAAWVLVHLVEAVFALALFVPAIVPMAWYAIVSPIVAVERVGPWRALGRSYRLVRPRFGAVLGVCLLVALVDGLLAAALGFVALAGLGQSWGWVLDGVVRTGVSLVTVPFVAGAAVLLYLDLRVRHEGLDIEVAASERFPDG